MSKNHANVKGMNNPRAKRWKVISPDGTEFIVNGNMDEFCKTHNLAASVLRTIGNTGNMPSSGRCVGWKVLIIQPGSDSTLPE